MKHGLIDQADIDALSADPEVAFVQFEAICRQSLEEILASLGQNDDWTAPQLRYMARVASAARSYGITGWDELTVPDPHHFEYLQFRAFEHDVTQLVTGLQIRKAQERKVDGVKLPASRAADIAKYVEVLRRRIEVSDFDEKKKAVLYKKLEALRAELTGSRRADLSKTMVIIASIVTTLNQTEAALIKLPDAIAAVMKVIGQVKDDEEAEKAHQAALAAAAKPKAIEDKRLKMQSRSSDEGTFATSIDDDIPF